MIEEDKELEEVSKNLPNKVDENQPKMVTEFSNSMDKVKQNILAQASVEDDKFIDTIKENVKHAATKLTEVEKGKAEYQVQQVDYEKEKLDTKQKKNINEQKSDDWTIKQRRRQFHFDGVKPIMNFVGITEPMNLFFLYFLAIVLTPLFLIAKIFKGSIGALIAGAQDSNRSKSAKGFLWTMACLLSVLILICLVYLFLKTQGIDLLANIRN